MTFRPGRQVGGNDEASTTQPQPAIQRGFVAQQGTIKEETLRYLGALSAEVSSLKFGNIAGLDRSRKAQLESARNKIVSSLNSLIEKIGKGQDATAEMEFLNSQKASCTLSYLLNYKSNLQLVWDMFGKDASSSPGSQQENGQTPSFHSSSKIHQALSREIYSALMGNLNTASISSWSQGNFEVTYGNSENFRQYVDNRCADIGNLRDLQAEGSRQFGSIAAGAGILEEFYYLISPKNALDPLADAESRSSDLAKKAMGYLAATFRFGLEAIRHNQLLYAPPAQEAMQVTVQEEKAVAAPNAFYQEQAAADATSARLLQKQIKMPEEQGKKPEKQEKPPSFEETYDPMAIDKSIADLKGKKKADYLTPYVMLLSKTEKISSDYASKTGEISQKAQTEAYIVMKEAKEFATGCEIILATASFITGPAGSAARMAGSAAMSLMIGEGAVDEARMIFSEVDQGKGAAEIIRDHASSIGLYLYMGAMKIPRVQLAMRSVPHVQLGISSYFAYDLGKSLVGLSEQGSAIDEAVHAGQMSQQEASLAKLDLVRSTVTTAAFFSHTVKNLPMEAKATVEYAKARLQAAYDEYISTKQQGALQLMRLESGEVVDRKVYRARLALEYLSNAKTVAELERRADDLADPNKAQRIIANGEQKVKPGFEANLEQAQMMEAQGKHAEAAGIYKRLLEGDPGNAALRGKVRASSLKAASNGDAETEIVFLSQAAVYSEPGERKALFENVFALWKEMEGRTIQQRGAKAALGEGFALEGRILRDIDDLPMEISRWLQAERMELARNYYNEGKDLEGAAGMYVKIAENSSYETRTKCYQEAAAIHSGAGNQRQAAWCYFKAVDGAPGKEAGALFRQGLAECRKLVDAMERKPEMLRKHSIGEAVDIYLTFSQVMKGEYRARLFEKAGAEYGARGSDLKAMDAYAKALVAWPQAPAEYRSSLVSQVSGFYGKTVGPLYGEIENAGKLRNVFDPKALARLDNTATGYSFWLKSTAYEFAEAKLAELDGKPAAKQLAQLGIFESVDRLVGRLPVGEQKDFYGALLTQKPSWEPSINDAESRQGEIFVSRTLLRAIALDAVRPGAFEKMHREKGIHHFGRYDLETLVKEYDGMGKKAEWALAASGEKSEVRAAFRKYNFRPSKDDIARISGLKNGEATNFDNGDAIYTVERQGSRLKVHKAVVAVIYPYADHNGAFNSQSEMLQKLSEKFNVQIVEAATVREAARRFIAISQEHGKICTVILGGHGSFGVEGGVVESKVDLGSENLRMSDFLSGGVVAKAGIAAPGKFTEGKLDMDMSQLEAFADGRASQAIVQDRKGGRYIAEKRGKSIELRKEGYLSKYCTDQITVTMISCSQGAPSGFAESMSARFPNAIVHAPRTPSAIRIMDYQEVLKNGRVNFSIDWTDQGVGATYVGGQPKPSEAPQKKPGLLGRIRSTLPGGKRASPPSQAMNAEGEKFASLIETRNAMKTKDLVDRGLAKPLQEIVVFERITVVPKEKLAQFAESMGQYLQEYPDVTGTKEPIKSLSGVMDSFKIWQGQAILGQQVNANKDIADFMKYLADNKLPHELGCRMDALNILLAKNFGVEYEKGVKADRFYGTAPVFEISCTNGKHFIAKVEDISQEVFAHNVHRMFGDEPGYRIFSGNGVGVMEIVDGVTLKTFLKRGSPGMKEGLLAPGCGSAERERFISTLMESMARQVTFTMDDTTEGNYMVLSDGSARRIDFMDAFFQKAESITRLDIRIDKTLGVVTGKSNKYELEIMREAFTHEWARLQAKFAENKAEVKEAFAAHEWGWKAMMAGERNFGWKPGTNLGEVMFNNLEKNLSYTPGQAWDMFVNGTGAVK